MNPLNEALHFRHATKEFDKYKKIDDNILYEILNAGILAPSSFGLEPWEFIVVQSDEIKEKLEKACFNQKQITSSSDVVVFVTKIKDLDGNSSYIDSHLSSRVPKKVVEIIKNNYNSMVENFSEDKFFMWLKAQCYIPATLMMTYAASLKVDSCPLEGFDESRVLEVLNLDKDEYGVALVLPLGYRIQEPKKKQRKSFDEVVFFK